MSPCTATAMKAAGHRTLRIFLRYNIVPERSYGPVAQRLEQRTHNPLVVGSNPTGPTKHSRFHLMKSLSVQFFRFAYSIPGEA
jgi:hypothetical protein